MMTTPDDYPLHVLLEVAKQSPRQGDDALSSLLIEDLYVIQKKYQFAADTDLAANEVRRRVEREVDQIRQGSKK